MKKRIGNIIMFVFLSISVLLLIFFGIEVSKLGIRNNDIMQKANDFKKDKKRIVFVTPQMDYPVWLQAKDGFDHASRDFGFYGSWVGGGNCDINDMLREIDIAASEKVDGIITCPLNPTHFSSIFEKIMRMNIPLITVAVDAESEKQRTAHIGSNYTELGYKQAKYLHDKVGDSLRIGIIMSNIDTQNQVIQCASLREYIKKIPSAKIVAVDEDWSDPVIGISVLSKMLDEHPEINAIFGTEGGGASGFAKVITDRSLKDKITVIGMDIIEDNLNVIEEGTIYGVMSQDYYRMGYHAGEYAYKKSMGMDVPSITYTETQLITKVNVNSVRKVR